MNKIDLSINSVIDNIFNKYNANNLILMKNEILKYKTYDLERLSLLSKEIKCNECIKTSTYLDRKNNKYLCWYHGLLISKCKS